MRALTAIVTAVGLLALPACQPAPAAPIPTRTAPTDPPTLTLSATPLSPSPTAANTYTPTPAPTLTAAPTITAVSSPIEGVSLAELSQIITNPFAAPLPGRDDGHHGTDFAFYRWGDRVGILGTPVHAVFDGRVAALVADRPPYGNAVIVETAWSSLPAGVQALLTQPDPPTPVPGSIRLTCPGFLTFPSSSDGHPSLYLLYAHLAETPSLKVGDSLASGQAFAQVGNTGNSTNPHLHLETRAGPQHATFSGMAHYIANASDAEMNAYCTWRVSGEFPMFDPVQILDAAQGP